MLKRFLFFMFIVVAVNATAQTSKRILVVPANGGTVEPNERMTFNWKPPITATSGQTYKIKIVEIIGDQSPEQALRSNKPFFEKDSASFVRTNKPFFEKDSTIYLTVNTPFAAGKKYAWSVQVLNRDGKPVTGNNGTNEVLTFRTANPVRPVRNAVPTRQK
jgi:hypothetical protein